MNFSKKRQRCQDSFKLSWLAAYKLRNHCGCNKKSIKIWKSTACALFISKVAGSRGELWKRALFAKVAVVQSHCTLPFLSLCCINTKRKFHFLGIYLQWKMLYCLRANKALNQYPFGFIKRLAYKRETECDDVAYKKELVIWREISTDFWQKNSHFVLIVQNCRRFILKWRFLFFCLFVYAQTYYLQFSFEQYGKVSTLHRILCLQNNYAESSTKASLHLWYGLNYWPKSYLNLARRCGKHSRKRRLGLSRCPLHTKQGTFSSEKINKK